MATDAHRAVRIDAPRELDPELVLLPDLPRIHAPRIARRRFSEPLARRAQHGLAETEPLRVVSFVGMDVVSLRGDSHGQDVVGKVGRLAPRGRQRHVQSHELLVREDVDPGEAVGVRPHRVVDAREIDLEPAAPILQQVGQQHRHLVHRQRILGRPVEIVPYLGMGRHVNRSGHELVGDVGMRAAFGADRAGERVEQEERAGDLPSAEVAGGGAAPRVGRQARASAPDHLGELGDRRRLDTRLLRCGFERVAFVEPGELGREILKRRLDIRMLGAQILEPVPPAPHELAVVETVADQVAGDRQQDRRLGPRNRRDPVVRVGRRVGQANVEDDDFCTPCLGVDDALRMGVEVVTRFEVGADQQDDVRIGVVGARAVDAHPVVVARAAARRADVGVRVVGVQTPGGEHALGVAVLARPTDVVHDLVSPVFLDRASNPRGDIVERFVPRDAQPLPFAARSRALQRVEDAMRVLELVQRRRSLGAVPATRSGPVSLST